MSEGVEFSEDMLAALEAIYHTSSMADRRQRIRAALDLDPGEAVLSVGTGPGFESRALAEAVGEDGRVHGIDTAEPMLEAARQRCSDLPWATFEVGDAAALPAEDGTFDAAAAVQVYEYVPDVQAALRELYRVLRPGGRAVVFDSDWSTMVYATADDERSERVLRAFDAHCAHPRLARWLAPELRTAGFDVSDAAPFVHFETELDGDAVGGAFLAPIGEVAAQLGSLEEAEVEAWVDDVRARAADGEYFFSFNQYLFLVEKPG